MVLDTCEICGADPEEENQPAGPYKDLKPEYCQYQDEGCEHARSCLECPFPHCLYDEPHGRQHWLKQLRNKEIVRLFKSGRNVKELALAFAVSRRTIHRAIKTTGKKFEEEKSR
jgi:hypothetical protein